MTFHARPRAAHPALLLLLVLLCSCGRGSGPDPSRVAVSEEILQADVRLAQGDTEGARDALVRTLQTNPKSFHAHYRLGVITLLEDPPFAEEHLAAAHRLSPKHPGPLFFEGLLRAGTNRFAAGDSLMAEAFSLSLASRPYALRDTSDAVRLALEAVASRRPTRATPILRRVALADSSNAVVWYLYGDAVFLAGDSGTALDIARHVLRLEPGFLDAQALEAACLYRQSRRPEARATVDALLARDQQNALGLFVSGHLFLDASEYRPGMIHLWQAVLADPTDPEYFQALGTAFMRFGSPDFGSRMLQYMEWSTSFLGRYLKWPGYVAEN